VFGTNFMSGLSVQLTAPGGAVTTLGSSVINVGSSTAFSMTATLATPGAYSLKVVNPSGQLSDPWIFTVAAATVPPPAVTGVSAAFRRSKAARRRS
jgi:hypothetical protein